MTKQLLAIGGPRHGEKLPHSDKQRECRVPVPIKVTAADYRFMPDPAFSYVVHAGYVISRSDGDRHWVSAQRVADLYGLNRRRLPYRILGDMEPLHRHGEHCLYPDESGDYTLPVEAWTARPSFEVAIYNARIVSDRLVWVYVGE
jgi:hypothetical protein